jgi:hypothetical protein
MSKRRKTRNGRPKESEIAPEVEAFLPPAELGPEFDLLNERIDRTAALIRQALDDQRSAVASEMTAHAQRLGEMLGRTRTRIDEYQAALARLEARVAALDARLSGRAGALPVARLEAEASDSATAAPPPPTPPVLAELLRSRGLEVIDRRKSGGALWVVGGPELTDTMVEINALGIATFVPAASGRSATGNRPGWFTKTEG